jgi:hypothetical protein
MKRAERARIVRDFLLSRPLNEWDRSRGVPTLRWYGVYAVLLKREDMIISEADAEVLGGNLQGLIGQSALEDLYTMDVWVKGERVPTVAWNSFDEITVKRMKRGAWECNYFKLPVPTGRSRPTIH